MITIKKPLDEIIDTISEKVGGDNKSFKGILKNSNVSENIYA